MAEHTAELVELKITGMSCSHCRAAVETALGRVPGVEGVSVDLAEGKAEVRGRADLADLLAAVQAEGYGARPAA